MKTDLTVDATGLSCPMPIVKAKKAMETLQPGQVLEVLATDKGSLADVKAWANTCGHHYIGAQQEQDVFKHYIRKANPDEVKEDVSFPHTIENEKLQQLMDSKKEIVILDVREPAEFAFGHIPNAINIPLGELSNRLNELNQNDEIYVICRTGNRSDYACRFLSEHGFKNVKNVLPGMHQWDGPIEKHV